MDGLGEEQGNLPETHYCRNLLIKILRPRFRISQGYGFNWSDNRAFDCIFSSSLDRFQKHILSLIYSRNVSGFCDPKNKRKENGIQKPKQRLYHRYKIPAKRIQKFLLIMFIFGIGNFHKSFLILRVQQRLTPTSGIIIAGTFAVLFYTIRNFAQAVSDHIVGGLGDKISKKILLAVFGFIFFGLVSLGFIYTTTSFSYFIALFVLSGISTSGVAIEKAYAAELLSFNLRGTGYGILNTVDGVGDFISSFFVGTIWTILSPSIAFGYGAIVSFIAAFLLLGIMKK